MSSYVDFAYVYDRLICQDYEKWADYIEEIFKKNKIKPNLVLDLGCGTGSITNILSKRGYDMIGVDISCDMLNVARDKMTKEGQDVLYLCQDIRNFELYGTVDAVLCTLDVLNYITDEQELKKIFGLVKNYLNSGGIFIFDINTRYKFENILSNNTFVTDENGVFYTWENEYENDLSTQYFTFFKEEQNGQYSRFDEIHIQRAYDEDKLCDLLKSFGFSVTGIYDVLTFKKPSPDCEKTVIVSKCFD